MDKKAENKTAYQDNSDRIEVERRFSVAKRKFGLCLLHTKREDTTRISIVLSVIAMNISRLVAMFLRFGFQLFNPFFPLCHAFRSSIFSLFSVSRFQEKQLIVCFGNN